MTPYSQTDGYQCCGATSNCHLNCRQWHQVLWKHQ